MLSRERVLKTKKAHVLTGWELFYEALTSEASQGKTRIRRKIFGA
jgi:hypothetical protein